MQNLAAMPKYESILPGPGGGTKIRMRAATTFFMLTMVSSNLDVISTILSIGESLYSNYKKVGYVMKKLSKFVYEAV